MLLNLLYAPSEAFKMKEFFLNYQKINQVICIQLTFNVLSKLQKGLHELRTEYKRIFSNSSNNQQSNWHTIDLHLTN